MIIDLDAPGNGGIKYRRFSFPDGQPHCEFDSAAVRDAARNGAIELIGGLRGGDDLLNMALAIEAITSVTAGTPGKINLNISYLLGARMDRRIAPGQPATLSVVTSMLEASADEVACIRVLDPHSPATLAALPGVEVLYADTLVAFALEQIERDEGAAPVVVIPDAGAIERTNVIMGRLKATQSIARCSKKRDSQTGKLSGFHFDEGDVAGRTALIVDDICDGGGTFAGIAETLRAHGATRVHLCVTHGIFSKGIEIAGIDSIFSTDSYRLPNQAAYEVERDTNNKLVLRYKLDGRVRLTLMTRFVAGLVSRIHQPAI
jgi:ribose-phosphate pyrophosphokinase